MRSTTLLLALRMLSAHKATTNSPDPYFQTFKTENSPLKIIMHSDFGGPSHTNMMLEIAASLDSSKHTVKLAASKKTLDFARNHTYISSITLEPSLFDLLPDSIKNKPRFPRKRGEIFNGVSDVFIPYFSAAYEASYIALKKVVLEERPDILLCDFFALACKDLAVTVGVPMVVMLYTTEGVGYETGYLTSKSDNSPSYIYDTSLWNRFDNLILTPNKKAKLMNPLVDAVNSFRKKYNVPTHNKPFGDFYNHLVLANTFAGLESAQAIPPNIKMVGPIFPNKTQPLSEEITQFLSTKSKVLYVGFGSRISLDTQLVEIILSSASILISEGLLDGIVWGLGFTQQSNFPKEIHLNDTLVTGPELTSNKNPLVYIDSWAPQLQLLKHPSVKVFLSHGGLTSSMETSSTGTPVVCLPFFGDQPRNCMKLEEAGVGIHVSNNKFLTDAELAKALKIILVQPSIKGVDSDKNNKDIGEPTQWEVSLKTLKTLAQFPYGYGPEFQPKNVAANEIIRLARLAHICRPTNLYPPISSNNLTPRSNRPCELNHILPPYKFIEAENNDFYLNWDVYLLVLISIVLLITLTFLVGRLLMVKLGISAKTNKFVTHVWEGYSQVSNKQL